MEEPAPEPRAPMTLKSVNVSMPTEVRHDGKTVTTGSFKERVEGRVMVRRLNLDGDGQADLWGHGGAFRAVYAYSHENYDYWARELGRDDFAIGQFGENFTVEGMGDDEVCVGDVFRIGGALVEVSQPRIPCYKLALKMGIGGFQNRFLESGRVGFYLRVIEEGEVGAGDEVVLVKRDHYVLLSGAGGRRAAARFPAGPIPDAGAGYSGPARAANPHLFALRQSQFRILSPEHKTRARPGERARCAGGAVVQLFP